MNTQQPTLSEFIVIKNAEHKFEIFRKNDNYLYGLEPMGEEFESEIAADAKKVILESRELRDYVDKLLI